MEKPERWLSGMAWPETAFGGEARGEKWVRLGWKQKKRVDAKGAGDLATWRADGV